ncbi:MAG: tetratricopeptide repeat protein [Myxococcales bacterium]|nr:tetratricopeptide repeat protein [Myxococcales bacterium]
MAPDLPSPIVAELPLPVEPELVAPVEAPLPKPVGETARESAELANLQHPGTTAPTEASTQREEISSLEAFDEAVADLLTEPIPADALAPEPKQERQERPAAAARPAWSRRRILAIVGGSLALLVVGGGGTAWYLLHGRRPAEAQALVDQACVLLGDDLYLSFRKAAEQLSKAQALHANDREIVGLLAQAYLGAARAGGLSEVQQADEVLRRLQPRDQGNPEVAKARALRDLLAGRVDDARRALAPLASKNDTRAAVYLGWVELQAGKLSAAEQAFREALARDDKLPAAHLGIGQVRQRQGDRPGAMAAYDQVLQRRPTHFTAAVAKIQLSDDPAAESRLLETVAKLQASASPRELAEIYTLLGTQALAQSRRKDAEERLRKALAAAPSFVPAQVALAGLLCEQDKTDEAYALSRRAVAAEPKNVEAWLVLVRVLLQQKKPLDAGQALQTLVQLAPKDARVLYWQGRREEAVAAAGSDDKAAQFYQKAVEADPRYIDAYIGLSRVLTRQGRATDALAALRQVAAQAQDDPQLAAALGDAYLAGGDSVKAEEALRLALSRKPDLLAVRMSLAQALEQQGRLAEAERELATVAELNKSYPGLSERRAQLLLRQGRYEEAEVQYLEAAAAPGASQALRLDAASYNLKSHPAEAEEILRAVLKEDPRSSRAHTLFALLRLQQQEVGEAALHAELATKLNDSPEALLARGMVLLAQGRRLEALDSLAKARRPPVEAMAMVMHARQLAAENQHAEAMEELNSFIARHQQLLADRMIYRPDDVSELLGGAYLLQGDLLTLAQKEDKALRFYELAARTMPKSGEAAARYGRALYHAGKRSAAIRELVRAIQLGGDQAPYALESYLLLGDSYREAKQRAESLRAYNKWLSLAPPTAPERHEVETHVLALSDPRRR